MPFPSAGLYQASALTASVRARSFSVKMSATLVSTGTLTPLTVALPVAAFAVLQIIVGALFAAIFLSRSMPAALHRLPFKASMIVFSLFCAGDILLGDPMELWEHGTFMILTVVTYMLFLSRYEERHVAVARLDSAGNRRLESAAAIEGAWERRPDGTHARSS
jgi:hypothetical protein